ncbi:MAG: hypothetical protein ACLTWR_03760 [Agathobaculum desmolans]|uniref:hypothetical protein n=1 Tax=Agathobaculum desmolans TaxID=39484 RepID=UPI0004E12DB1
MIAPEARVDPGRDLCAPQKRHTKSLSCIKNQAQVLIFDDHCRAMVCLMARWARWDGVPVGAPYFFAERSGLRWS